MKLASKILGALAVAMMVVTIVMTFVVSDSLMESVTAIGGNENTGVGEALAGFLSAGAAFFGFFGYVGMNVIGVCMILYAVLFIYKYIMCNYIKRQSEYAGFFTRFAVLSGIFIFFAIGMFCQNPDGMKGLFALLTAEGAVNIAFVVVNNTALKKSCAAETETDAFDESCDGYPEVEFDGASECDGNYGFYPDENGFYPDKEDKK